MSATLTIARREIAEKKFVFAAALAFAVLPFILAAIPGTHMGLVGTLITSTIFAAAFAGGLAVILGSSFVARDISDGRMSFYFSRPVSAAAIWFGKLTGALLLVVLSFFIIFGPGLILSAARRGLWRQAFPADSGAALAVILIACLVLLLLAHVLSTFVRSRSPWIALDFAIAVAVAVAIFAMVRPLFLGQATLLTGRLLAALGIAIVASVIAAGAFQLADGRTDRVRSHLALSRFLWLAVGLAVVIAGAYVWWVVSATPRDLLNVYAHEQSASGGAAILVGQAQNRADYHAGFLIDPATGAFERLHPTDWYSADFVAGGTKLLEIVRSTRSGSADVFLRDARPDAPRFDPRITVAARWDSKVAVSDDARQMAVIDGGSLSIYDIASRQSLGTVQIPKDLGRVHAMFFPAKSVARLYLIPQQGACAGCVPQDKPRTISILEFDANSRQLAHTGATQATGRYARLGVSADGTTMAVRTNEALSFHDARTGATLASPVVGPGERLGYATTFLRDGGAAVAVEIDHQFQIRVFNRDGSLRHSIPIGPARRVWPIREVAAGKLVAGTSSEEGAGGHWAAVCIDSATGAVIRREANLRPTFGDGLMWWSGTDPRRGMVTPAQLYDVGTKGLVRWNALTGEKNMVVPGA